MARRLKLGQLLISKGLLDPEQLASALAEQERWGSRLGMTLVRLGYIEEDMLVKVLSRQLQLPVARIAGKRVKREILERVPAELAEKYRCLPLFTREEAGSEVLYVGMDDPSDLAAIDELSFRIEREVKTVLVAPTELEDALQRNYHGPDRPGADRKAPGADRKAPGADAPAAPGVGTVPEPDTAPESLPDPELTLPPMKLSVPEPDTPGLDDTDSDTEPQLPPMDAMLAGLEDDPVLGGLEDDPLLGGLDHDPVLGGDDPDDLAGMSFSAAGEEPVADLARAPFGDSDPDLGGFAGGPFASSGDDPIGSFGETFDGDLAAAPGPEPAASQAASSASLEATVIIKALAQLLVEKGVIGREEFAERLRRLAAKNAKSA